MRKVALLLFALWIAATGSSQSRAQDNYDKQDLFCADIPSAHSAPIPKIVLSMLLQTDAGKNGVAMTNECIAAHRCKPDQNQPASLFRAIEVHLAAQGETDLLVIGICPMCGADNDWFWLVRTPDKNPTVVLWTGDSCVQILHSQTHGLKDVRSTWYSAAASRKTTYQFDGRTYERRKQGWRDRHYK